MMKLAIIENGIVKNIVLAEDSTGFPGAIDVTGIHVGPGWLYDGQSFTEPASTVPRKRYLTQLQFRGRFTDAEKVALYTAAESSVAIRIYMDDLRALGDTPVDLDDPRTIAGVQALEAAGIIGSGRAAVILA